MDRGISFGAKLLVSMLGSRRGADDEGGGGKTTRTARGDSRDADARDTGDADDGKEGRARDDDGS